jgi:A/G-specific adenine glycosylase
MLQQTRVAAVVPYYLRWMARFPTFAAAAESEEEEVLCLWSGLGYYVRARRLWQLCGAIHGSGAIPATPAEWQKFPGVGAYSAAAIASIGQNYDTVALDANGIRILCRLAALGPLASKSSAEKAIRPLAAAMLIPGRCGALSEALMDLGSVHCRSRGPDCAGCPLRLSCAVSRNGLPPEKFPSYAVRKNHSEERPRLWLSDGSNLWLAACGGNRLSGLFELPELPPGSAVDPPLYTIRRHIATTTYVESVHKACDCLSTTISSFECGGQNIQPFPIGKLDQVPISGPHRRCIAAILADLAAKSDSEKNI